MVIGLVGFWPAEHRRCCSPRSRCSACTRRCSGRSSTRSCRSTSTIDELVGGNGLVEMGTFVAILLGTIAGGLVVAIKPDGPLLAGALAIARRRRGLAREPRASR